MAAAPGSPSQMDADPILTVVLDNSAIIDDDLGQFETLQTIPEKVEFIRSARRRKYDELEVGGGKMFRGTTGRNTRPRGIHGGD